jgi:hypothetical protein
MTDQVVIPDGEKDPEKYLEKLAAKKDQPFNWIKIIPSIKLGEFDRIRKIWSRTITYHIQKYEIKNLKVNIGPGATAKNPVKSYICSCVINPQHLSPSSPMIAYLHLSYL